jgi:ketosteroid isomerase-like protein
MKNILLGLFSLGLLVVTSCHEKIDIAKEKEAIIAVVEADKTAYLNQDNAAMGEFWIKDVSSKKIWWTDKGEQMIEGWEAINASQLKETRDTSWNRKLVTCTFSDFQINVTGNSAWLTSKTNWKGTLNGNPFEMNQSRVICMKKTDGKWKFTLMALYNFPMKAAVANSESSKGLNQLELHKQFVGSWKGEMAKDTTIFWDVKPYGTGMECYFKSVSKGKIVMDGKQLWGYDTGAGKFTMAEMMKGVDNAIYSTWFDSKSTCTMQYYKPVTTTANGVNWEWKIEFKNPDMFVETILKNNKPTQTITMNRVK